MIFRRLFLQSIFGQNSPSQDSRSFIQPFTAVHFTGVYFTAVYREIKL